MAYPNDFIPEVWSARLLDTLDKSLVLGQLANRDYESAVQGQGDTVHAQKFGNVTAGAYSGSVTYAAESSSTVSISLNQDYYGAVSLDDKNVLQGQTGVDQINGFADRIAYGLADQIDQGVAGLYTSSTLTDIAWDVGTTDPWDGVLTTAAEQLNAANVPQQGRWLVVRPKGMTALLESADFQRATEMGDNAMANGIVGRAAGFDVYISNNLVNISSNNYAYMYGHSMGISLAVQQAPTIELVRRDAAFETGVRARVVYGVAATQPTAFGEITADES